VEDRDEGRHTPGPEPWWAEQWAFDAWTADGRTGCYAVVTLLPNARQAWYWCALVRPGEPLLSVVDLDQPLPTDGLRLRAGQLWADHVCEAPFAQWTVVNETYAVALDNADEALGRALGDPTPIAFDLEWYATADATARADGYRQAGEVRGVVELRGARLDLDGPAARHHVWGPVDWSTSEGEPTDGARAPVLLAVDGRRVALEHTLTSAGWHRWRHPLMASARPAR
jgi:hypothetical protein